MFNKRMIILLWVATAVFPRSFTLLSPNGGGTFTAGQRVTVQWVADSIPSNASSVWLDLQYTVDGGKIWLNVGHDGIESSGSFSWIVPHLQYQSDSAYLRMKPRTYLLYDADSTIARINIGDKYSYDTTDAPFTILPSTADPYEPNEGFTMAYEISSGDRAIKDAFILKAVPTDNGVPSDDADFFKLSLTAGKIVLIQRIYDDNYYDEHQWGAPTPLIVRLYDASQNQIYAGSERLSYSITQSGMYYCEINTNQSQPPWERYSFSIKEVDNTVTLLSPNGGENLRTDEVLEIRWAKDTSISMVNLFYSIDSGATWKEIGWATGDTFLWNVPPLLNKTDNALIKVEIANVTVPSFDVSNIPFTILAIPPDAYEPNDDLVSAYPIAVGDSVVTHATSGMYTEDPAQVSPGYGYECDFYKVSLPASSFVIIHPWVHRPEDWLYVPADTSSIESYWPVVRMCRSDQINDTFDIVSGGVFSLCHFINEAGVHYFSVQIIGGYGWGWKEYGVSIYTPQSLYSQTSVVNTASMQEISVNDTTRYSAQLYADTTNLRFNIVTRYKTPYTITTTILAPDDFPDLSDIKKKVKVFAVHSVEASVSDAQISVPYSLSELNGNPEQSLAVVAFGNSTGRWEKPQITIDTVDDNITVQALETLRGGISFYLIYISSEKTAGIHTRKPVVSSGITVNCMPHMGGILVQSYLPKGIPATLQLYDLNGKCIKKETVILSGSENATYLWNPGTLANGKYFLRLVAGTVQMHKPILIMK